VDDEVSKDGEDGRGSHGGEDEFVFGRLLHGVHCSVWGVRGQGSTVRNEGEEDEDHRDAHGKEGDEEHVGRAAVVVHALIITYPGEDARGISKKILACRKACGERREKGPIWDFLRRIYSFMSYKSRDS